MSFLSESFSLFPVKPERSISINEQVKKYTSLTDYTVETKSKFEFKGYVTTNEDASDDLEITSHPVQQGAPITDHAFKLPSQVGIRILVNDNDVPLSESYEKLLKLQTDRIPMKLVTGKKTYTNMLLKSVKQTTDRNTENVLALSLSLQEIIIVEVTSTLVPPRSKQKKAGSTGATEKGGRKSILKTGEEAGSKFLTTLKGIL